MSRAYRIRVSESLRKVIRGGDRIGTHLEVLPVLARDQIAALLVEELMALGFEREGHHLLRTADGVSVRVDPETGAVEIEASVHLDLDLNARRVGFAEEDEGERGRKEAEEHLRRRVQSELEQQAGRREAELNRQATDLLEAALRGIQTELEGVVNRVTIAALKRKAAQLGTIKELTEDAQAGSMTIVLEV
jgi:hypothetical protein